MIWKNDIKIANVLMNCETIQSLLSPYLNGKLHAAQRKQIAQHLQNCEDCQRELAFDQKLTKAFRSKSDLPPLSPDFNQALLTQATGLQQPFWKKANVFCFERPWLACVFGIAFSLILALLFPSWNKVHSLSEILMTLFSFKLLLISLTLLIAFWVFYVNEKFIEKKIFSANEN